MLTATRESDGQKVAAWEAAREDAPFICFCCRQTVRLKKGEIKAPHFAHVPPVTCEYGTGESEAHRLCKIALYENFTRDSRVRKCEMERDLGTVRPDVSAYINDVPVAIEVQLSNLSLPKIQYRTLEYAQRNLRPLASALHACFETRAICASPLGALASCDVLRQSLLLAGRVKDCARAFP